ncbi:MAG: iron-containing alcohol dehydrogenase [Candidatus Latescibacter sp.]|nr:iron-containing alcohol dehydrogenase [Candidatus Latescibacter sp.]
MIPTFTFTRTPRISFGAGTCSEIPGLAESIGKRVLLVTGGNSFHASNHWTALAAAFQERSLDLYHISVKGEPSPELVDSAVSEYRPKNIKTVVAIGGGSVIDTGKAISAMLPQTGSVFDYLEGVGTGKKHDGRKVPFIAVPTTAGTGSEATKNAVLSRVGPQGFKKSLRHDNLVPDYAVVDPELSLSCPAYITASCGMDAFTQLLESYVSPKSTPLTESLALSGMEQVSGHLIPVCTTGASALPNRTAMAYGALLSGITLANAGLGVVHGLAATIGGLYTIPHGVICGVLLGPATRVTIEALLKLGPAGDESLKKYSRIGFLLSGSPENDVNRGCALLIEKLYAWTKTLKLPLLSDYGIKTEDIETIASKTGSGNNPVKLGCGEIREILRRVIT